MARNVPKALDAQRIVQFAPAITDRGHQAVQKPVTKWLYFLSRKLWLKESSNNDKYLPLLQGLWRLYSSKIIPAIPGDTSIPACNRCYHQSRYHACYLITFLQENWHKFAQIQIVYECTRTRWNFRALYILSMMMKKLTSRPLSIGAKKLTDTWNRGIRAARITSERLFEPSSISEYDYRDEVTKA